jgi:hypothetical protein
MVDVDHQAWAEEIRADGAVLLDLSECMHGLHLSAMPRTRHQWDALHQELAVLHEEFGTLHARDMSGDLDRPAHDAWRARVRRLMTSLAHSHWNEHHWLLRVFLVLPARRLQFSASGCGGGGSRQIPGASARSSRVPRALAPVLTAIKDRSSGDRSSDGAGARPNSGRRPPVETFARSVIQVGADVRELFAIPTRCPTTHTPGCGVQLVSLYACASTS